MLPFVPHPWEPIRGLPDDGAARLVDPATQDAARNWLRLEESLRERTDWHEFVARLRRLWAIETGIIEGVYSIAAGSEHPGDIVNLARCDGSVAAVGYSIDERIWRALGTRAGGEAE